MKDFSQLTAAGQARRLRQLAFNSLTEYDLDVKRVRLLAYHFNAIFRIDTADGGKFVLRVNIPGIRSLGEIRAEARWLTALRRDTELVVPKPIASRDGALVTTASAPGVPEARHVVVFDWVPGRDLNHALTAGNYEKLGAFTARLHDHASSWVPAEPLALKTHSEIFLFDSPELFWESAEAGELVPPRRAEVVKQAVARIEAMLADLYQSAGSPHILHADLHQGNVRLNRGAMHALDFDDCLLGHFVQDVGITYYYVLGHPEFEQLTAAYRRGYESLRSWPETAAGQIDGMMAARDLLLAQFLYYAANPHFKPRLPRFFERLEVRLREYLLTSEK